MIAFNFSSLVIKLDTKIGIEHETHESCFEFIYLYIFPMFA